MSIGVDMGFNINSTKQELNESGKFMWDQLVRFGKSFWVTNWRDFPHAYMNLFTEVNRHFPYTKGHIEGVVVVIWIAIAVFT